MENIFNITKKMTLCGGKKCCPVVEIKDNITYITDDYGNKVQMETLQLKMLIDEGHKLFDA
jgi:hypothetical protein